MLNWLNLYCSIQNFGLKKTKRFFKKRKKIIMLTKAAFIYLIKKNVKTVMWNVTT